MKTVYLVGCQPRSASKPWSFCGLFTSRASALAAFPEHTTSEYALFLAPVTLNKPLTLRSARTFPKVKWFAHLTLLALCLPILAGEAPRPPHLNSVTRTNVPAAYNASLNYAAYASHWVLGTNYALLPYTLGYCLTTNWTTTSRTTPVCSGQGCLVANVASLHQTGIVYSNTLLIVTYQGAQYTNVLSSSPLPDRPDRDISDLYDARNLTP